MPASSEPPPGFSCAEFSVVIATRNRRHVVARAIISALAQRIGAPEVIVVDDASTDGTARYVTTVFPTVKFHRMPAPGGPGPCRNLGLRVASGRWVVILDDDDELRPDALGTIGKRLAAFQERERYPVFKFRRNDGTLTVPFQLTRVADLWGKTRHGDFVSVWNRELGLAPECRYPDHRLGAEGLLWIELTARYGMPTWADCVGIAHRDTGMRLLEHQTEPRDATDRAQIDDAFVRLLMPHQSDEGVYRLVTERMLIAGMYWRMAGRRREALRRAWTVLIRRRPLAALKLVVACAVPRSVVVRRFHARRDRHERTLDPTLEAGWE